jgi:hypothetical protein
MKSARVAAPQSINGFALPSFSLLLRLGFIVDEMNVALDTWAARSGCQPGLPRHAEMARRGDLQPF